MFCPNCGAPNPESAIMCGSCGGAISASAPVVVAPSVAYGPPVAPVSNHLVLAILTTLFCCLPFGVVAIIYSTQVNQKAALGDLPGALHASKRAQQWSIAAIVSLPLAYILMMIFAGGMAAIAPALQ